MKISNGFPSPEELFIFVVVSRPDIFFLVDAFEA
jgi:hypothetical protein